MLRPEQADRSRFPGIALLRVSAVDFGLGQEVEIAVSMGAIYAAVLAFADEAEDGAFNSIFVVYAQGNERVHVTLIAERDDAPKMVIERVNVGGANNLYLGGVIASLSADGSAWNVELARQTKCAHTVNQTKVDRFGATTLFVGYTIQRQTEDFRRGCTVDVLPFGKSSQQAFVAGQMRHNT